MGLSKLDLFQELPAVALRELERNTETANFRAGHVFFQQGEHGGVLFLLEKGQVQTFRSTGGKRLIITKLKPPAVFGEMGCLGRCVYHCSAQTTQLSRIRTVSKVQLDKLQERFPSITRRLLDLVSDRFLLVLLDLEATSFRRLIPRLANLLLTLAEKDCVMGVTHQEIAEHLRVYRESATAALGELRRAGIIAVERKQIRVVDRARLQRAARE